MLLGTRSSSLLIERKTIEDRRKPKVKCSNLREAGSVVADDARRSSPDKALTILASGDRQFASSEFIKLEVLPKAVYHRQTDEAEFYEAFFNAVTYWANNIDQTIQDSYKIACKYGLAAMDALHIAAAISIGAEEFITTEKSTKPMYRVTEVTVVYLFD